MKAFHCEIINDHEAINQEIAGYREIPPVRDLNNAIIQRNYQQIKQDVQQLIYAEMERLLADPASAHLVIHKA